MQANNPQAMSNALWAYATLRYDPGSQLMEAATQQLMDKLDLFNPQVGHAWSLDRCASCRRAMRRPSTWPALKP